MPEDIAQQVLSRISSIFDIPLEQINEHSTLSELGIDSLDAFNLLFMLEDEFGIVVQSDKAEDLRTVGQIIDSITRAAAQRNPMAPPD